MTNQEFINHVFNLAGPQRDKSFSLAVKEALYKNVKRIVATGCYRGIPGDGQSDIILSRLASIVKGSYDCVDIDSSHIAQAKNYVGASTVTFHNSCSVEYLRNRKEPIDFLYLDSMDFDPSSPKEAQEHQLNEARAAIPLLSNSCVVLLDDVGSENESDPPWLKIENHGKGKLSSAFLLENGFRCILKSYQWVFVRP